VLVISTPLAPLITRLPIPLSKMAHTLPPMLELTQVEKDSDGRIEARHLSAA